ncbi:MAG: hypothetical protein WDZ57_03255 [Demequina sp.]
MVYDPGGTPPDGPRGPVGGSSSLWIWITVGLGLLALLVIGPTLGAGTDNSPVNDPVQDPAGPNDPVEDDGPQTVIAA